MYERLGENRLFVQQRYKMKKEKKGGYMVNISYVDIERLVKRFKSHRCALDFDRGFINAILQDWKTEDIFWTK